LRHDDLVYVGRMFEVAQKVVAKTERLERTAFDADENLMYAVLHLIQIVGEAARSVSKDFAAAHTAIPWKEIIGMRMKIVHDCMDVNWDVVWAVATVKLPPLVKDLEIILASP
jgi:uncharacterized protein with HEPN domain